MALNWERLAGAAMQPVKIALLEALAGGEASPRKRADELHRPIASVSYHVAGCATPAHRHQPHAPAPRARTRLRLAAELEASRDSLATPAQARGPAGYAKSACSPHRPSSPRLRLPACRRSRARATARTPSAKHERSHPPTPRQTPNRKREHSETPSRG